MATVPLFPPDALTPSAIVPACQHPCTTQAPLHCHLSHHDTWVATCDWLVWMVPIVGALAHGLFSLSFLCHSPSFSPFLPSSTPSSLTTKLLFHFLVSSSSLWSHLVFHTRFWSLLPPLFYFPLAVCVLPWFFFLIFIDVAYCVCLFGVYSFL